MVTVTSGPGPGPVLPEEEEELEDEEWGELKSIPRRSSVYDLPGFTFLLRNSQNQNCQRF